MALTEYEKEIGKRLRNMRESRNLSRKAVETKIAGEISEFALEMYEKGTRRIPPSRLERLADFYGVAGAFLRGECSARDSGIQDYELEVALLTDSRYSKEEKDLLVHVINIIEAKRKAEVKIALMA